MNHTKELLISTSKQSLQSISIAFKKLLERVTSAQLRSNSTSRNIRRGSNSSVHNEQLHKKRKTSISLFHSRKNSYFFKKVSQPVQKSDRVHESSNDGVCKQKKSNSLNENHYTSVRCHSDPSFGNTNSLYKRINEHNQLLITKTYVFDELTPQSTSKNGQLRSFFRKNANPKAFNHTDINFDYNRIRHCDGEQRNNRYQKTSKSWKIHAKSKNSYFKAVQLDPWQTDKPQEESFIDH